jgi:hypothetical protein
MKILAVRVDKALSKKIDSIIPVVALQTGRMCKSDAVRVAILKGIESIKTQTKEAK